MLLAEGLFEKRGCEDLIFCLKTAIDDFRRQSSKFYALFIGFRDAVSSLKQSHMIKRLAECRTEETYCRIIADIYQDWHFEVICDQGISKEFNLNIGCKTGDPASPIFFIIDLDKSLRGVVELANTQLTVPKGRPISPIPTGSYADDIMLIFLLEKVFLSMVKKFKDNIEGSNLSVRPDKCSIFRKDEALTGGTKRSLINYQKLNSVGK